MATMKQVAERAGVSTSTVSHVINKTRAVSEDVRMRVLAVIDEMGYIPNAMARSLKNDKTRTIGVSVPDNTHAAMAELLRGIEDAAFAVGYNIMLCNGYEDPQRQVAHLRSLIEKRIDGLVLVAGAAQANEDLAALLSSGRVPVVLADHAVAGVDTDFVGLDHEATGYLATRHLLELGHRRIACIAGPLHEPSGSARLAGCRRALAEAGLALDPGLLVHGSADCQGGHDAARRLLGLDAPPSALFACNDLMALGALCAAREAGVEVPGALSVVGGDDLGVAAFAMPRLTTVAQPSHDMGRQLTELLLQRIRGDAVPRRHTRLQGRLVVRHSSAAP